MLRTWRGIHVCASRLRKTCGHALGIIICGVGGLRGCNGAKVTRRSLILARGAVLTSRRFGDIKFTLLYCRKVELRRLVDVSDVNQLIQFSILGVGLR
jgi:hypothetical protein